MIYIYGLTDPRDGLVKYVGRTVYPDDRFRQHLNHPTNGEMAVWIASLSEDGLQPSMVILDAVDVGRDASLVEKQWIRNYCGLYNVVSVENACTQRYKRLNVDLDEDIHEKIKIMCIKGGVSISEWLRYICEKEIAAYTALEKVAKNGR